MNKTIAMITVGILVAGIMAIATSTGSVFAASSGGTGSLSGDFTSHAEANPGISSTSAGGAIDASGNLGVGTSSAASDHGSVTTAAGFDVTCGGGTSTGLGSCASASSQKSK